MPAVSRTLAMATPRAPKRPGTAGIAVDNHVPGGRAFTRPR